jgi:hypothetical protein
VPVITQGLLGPTLLTQGYGPAAVTRTRFVDEDLRLYLLTLVPDPGVVVEKGKIAATQPRRRVYMQRGSTNRDVTVAGAGLLYETYFDIEVASLEDDADAQAICQHLKEGPGPDPLSPLPGLNGFRGTWGGHYIHGAFVSDHEDDYQPRLLDADEGYFIAAFRLLVIHEAA